MRTGLPGKCVGLSDTHGVGGEACPSKFRKWIDSLSPHTGTWSSPPITGTRPPPCARFSFTKIDEEHAVLFGGQGQGRHVTNKAYLIDLKKMVS